MTQTPFFSLFLVLGLGLHDQVLAVAGPGEGDNGGACPPDAPCNDANAVCSTALICTCDQQNGYVDKAGLCRKQNGTLGSACQVESDCFDTNSICSSGTCQCGAGYDPVGYNCNPITTTTSPTCTLNCTNGRVCVVDPEGGVQSCRCPKGFAGPECQFPDLCAVSSCPEGADCFVKSAEERICICPTGVSHQNCSELQPEGLVGGPCLTNTKVQCNDVNAFCAEGVLCLCNQRLGFVNVNGICEIEGSTTSMTTSETPESCSLLCTNGGSCVIDDVNGDRCNCPQEYTGSTCQFDNLCFTEPCPDVYDCIIDKIGEKICRCPQNTTCDEGSSTSESTTSMAPTDSTTSETCSIVCYNGGSCVKDSVNGDYCECPMKFTGLLCKTHVDHCINNPCTAGATCLSDASTTLGYICICPGDYKGLNCDEADLLVTCRDTNKTLHLEKKTTTEERSICLPKAGGDVNAVCTDIAKSLVYTIRGMDDTLINTYELQGKYCIEYFAIDASTPDYCVFLTAFEEDDRINRPWRNANATVCFIFNRRPEFLGPLEIRFNLPDMAASELRSLSARDPDVHQIQELKFSIEVLSEQYSNLFSLTSATGPNVELQTVKPDAILTDPLEIDILVKVKDLGIPPLSDERVVKVKFTDRQLLCEVNERPIYVHNKLSQYPQEIGNITCQPENTDITLSMQGDGDLGNFFYVEPATGVLFLNQHLQPGAYNFTVKAEVLQPVSVVAYVPVKVKIGNWSPNCSVDLTPFFMSENAPLDACSNTVYTCLNPSGRPVECMDGGSELFKIDCLPSEPTEIRFKLCAVVSLKDRVGQHTVDVTFKNEFGQTEVDFEAMVKNVNDKPQLVKDIQYNFTVPEDTAVGYIIGTVAVIDPDQYVVIDPPETLKVEILQPTGAEGQGLYPFTASLSSTQNYTTISLKSVLDATVSRQYQFLLKVTDSGGLSDSVPITVIVDDVNGNPICDPSHYEASMSVHDEPQSVVAVLQCYDNDVIPSFKRIVFEIMGDQVITDHFAVNSSGVVTLRRPLSDVTDPVLTFTVKVADARGLESMNSVTIRVSINSDFPPECDKDVITSSKSENTAEKICFTVESGCIEPVNSLPLTFEILSGNGLEIFRLDSNAPPSNNIVLCTKSSLKNRYGDWTLNGTATSDFGSTPITIVISISDINDPPQFTRAMYTGTVVENSQPGFRIVQVNATDPDSGGFGEITYSSADIGSSPLFSLDPNDGWVTVKQGAVLDADIEGSNEYKFIVQAVDKGPPHKTNVTAQVVITVTDVNDNAPVCEEPQSAIPLFLLAKPGEIVYQVACSDKDRSPEFNQLRYEISSQSVNGTFAIDAVAGVIRLTAALSRDTPEHEVMVLVKDSADPLDSNSFEFSLSFVVNNTVPARCTPSKVTDSIPETKPNNFCLQNQVECVDVTGGDTIQLTSSVGNGTKYFSVRERQETKEGVTKLFLSACISNSIKNNFGTYQIEGIVDNGLAETTVVWSVTVTDLNEPPKFDPPSYKTSIPENVKAGKIIAVTVKDPDENSPEKKFRLANVTAKSLNDGEFGGALSDAIDFFNSTKEFFVVVNGLLNATMRNEYLFQVKAMDGVGLQDTANVSIHITDVNEAPVCNEATVYFSTNILVAPGTVIGTLSCYDVDLEPYNKKLTYNITNGDSNGYFNMTSDGSIKVAKQLPRLQIPNDGTAILGIEIRDAGTPFKSTSVTAEIEVENKIPPVCNPVLQPPSIWVQSSCLTVTMGCSDPTSPKSNSHLRYDVSGNYTQTNPDAFNRTGDVPAVFDLCYTLTSSGFYEIKVEVDNSLSIYTYKEVVEVRYEEATPVFTQATFKTAVSEFTTANREILTASANSSNLIGELLYGVVGAESTPNWNEYFTLDTSNGKVTTKKSLKDLANTVMRLSVEVQDTKSKLKSSALVEITVNDENEEPTCDITLSEVTIDVDDPVGEEVLSFSCSDPDIVQEYRQLSYALTGSTNVNVYFELVPEAEKDKTAISLKSQLSTSRSSYDNRVDDSRSSFYVTLQVSDNGNPAKVYSKRVTINVSLLPPAVEWQILELGYSHVFVSWKYNRDDYYQVTKTFQIKLREQGSGEFYRTDVLLSDKRFDNVTGIKDNTEYEIFVLAVTEYGTRVTPISQIRTSEIPKLTKLIAIFNAVNIQYTDALRDPTSQGFKDVAKQITEEADFSLRESPGYVRTDVVRCRPGSLVIEISVYVNQTGNITNIRDLLAQIITSGYMGNMAVDSTFFYSSIDGGYVHVDTIELGSENVYNGGVMRISCSITTAGYETDPKFQSWWTFNGNNIRPTAVSRISTDFYPETVFPEIYMSILEINTVSPRDSGRYDCYVADSDDRTSSLNIDVKVISPPVVLLTPRSLTVESGSYVIVTCTLAQPLDSEKDFLFLWYRNGSDLQLQAGEEYNVTTGTLHIPRMTVTTIFGCRGQNEAGNGPLVESHIGVKPSVEVVKPCPPTTYRDIQWPETLPGLVAVAVCPAGYSGEFMRRCGAEGNWMLPNDSCVQDRLVTIKQQVNTIKDGSGTTTLTESLKELDSATDNQAIYGGDLRTAVGILDDAAVATNATGGENDTEQEQAETENFLKVCSTLIDERHQQTWETTIESDGYGANEVSTVAGRYLKTKAEQLSAKINTTFERVFDQKNIYAIIGKEFDKSITFPYRARTTSSLPAWVKDSGTKVRALKETFEDLPATVYDCLYFNNLTNKVVKTVKPSGNVADATKILHFNAEIVGFNVQGKTTNLNPPLEIDYGLYDANYSDPVCVYWDTVEKLWSPDGCYVDAISEYSVKCKCDHFTNFAILMSPGKTPPADVVALSIISAVGCAISMFCLLVTLIVHIAVWRIVKSDRAIILLNLCIALLIALALFLGGVGRTDNEDACTAIAVLLHYIFLVVFFLMLAEGIDIGVTIMYVFATKSRIKWLIPLSWLIPAVIVAISAGVTQLEGYGSATSCWLSTESGLLWAFVGPAAFVILVNVIIIIIVFRQMFTSSAMLTKSDKEKARTSLRSLCVLLPIMGITWVFGVFSVNESLVAFQYIFAIFNSLQGFFIFLFHCFLNKQLRDALKQRRARKKSLQSFEKSYKNQHSTGTGSTAYQTSEDKSKDVNTDQGAKLSTTSNPFLEADRQMKELVSKGTKTGNTFDKDANNKRVDKDKPPVDVALEDVKISNILRESEVMSGTAGISSIFTTQPDAGRERETAVETPTDDKNKIRESKVSSHTYDYAVEPSYSYSGGMEKPAGYEKLLPQAQQRMSTGYDRVIRSDDNVSAGMYSGGRDRDSGSHGRGMSGSRERIDENRDRLTGSSRSDDDYEAHVSQEIGASLPTKYDMKQAKKPEPVKKGKPNIKETGAVKKLSGKKKKEMEKDRSRMYQYQYPYEATYLGQQQQQSRHSSLENMGGYYVSAGYSPYAGMQPQGQTGRPTHQHQTGRSSHQYQQQQQYNPYGWGNQQRRDYW